MPGIDYLRRTARFVVVALAIFTVRPGLSHTPESPSASTETSGIQKASRVVPLPPAQPTQPSANTHLALAIPGPSASAYPNSNVPSPQPDESSLQQILITAQYRQERLVDTPVSVSVLSGKYLQSLAAIHLSDWANTVPGLSFVTSGAGYTQVSLRGVTVGTDISSTVGIYVDDVPYGSSTPFALGQSLSLDLATIDLSRIDVLRGPQGTLYGASSMGGLIKYVTNPPDLHDLAGTARAGVSTTRDGGISYDSSLTLNAPLAGDKAAIRATGYYTREGGYIDDPHLGQTNVNRSHTGGGRVDLLVNPIDQFDIRVSALAQNINRAGEDAVDYSASGNPQYGPLDQYRDMSEPFTQQFRLVSATVTYHSPYATFTSISSYQTARSQFRFDEPSAFLALFARFGLNYSAVGFSYNLTTDRLTQEIRLASQNTRWFDWLIGGYFTRENSRENIATLTINPTGVSVANRIYNVSDPSLYKEYAGYGDLTWHLSPKFDVTGGLRVAHNDLTYDTASDTGLFAAPEPTRSSGESVTTYLGNARYHISEQSITYLRYATGYRPGGPNFVLHNPASGQPLGPPSYQPDSLKSWELGYKTETSDHVFGVDAAVYYIIWDNIQAIGVVSGTIPGIVNAPGGAISKGAELTVSAHPVQPLVITGGLDFMRAYLRQAEPLLHSTAGEDLPNVPRFSGTLNADYVFDGMSTRPSIGATLRYVDARTWQFVPPLYHLPPYTTVDVHAGLKFGSVAFQLYARNIFDVRGQLSLQALGAPPPERITLLDPLTVGISGTVDF